MDRRLHIKNLILGIPALWSFQKIWKTIPDFFPQANVSGTIKHSVSRWCYSSIPLPELTSFCLNNNIHSIELLEPDEYQYVIRQGLECAVANGPETHIRKGFNNPQLHDYLLKEYKRLIPLAADAGIPNIICFSGDRNGLDDIKGLEYCAKGLEKVVKIAEKYHITLIMELLNSKVDHTDYQCDHSVWGIDLVKKVDSPQFKLLYDIYHMQIMEGNIIQTITENIKYFAHFHTAGVPGRRDLDEFQEINYPAIFNAIKSTGYKGFIGQEFIPKKSNPLDSLMDSIKLVELS
ncbi:MAG: TIM barrel protein [Saprospiraceae bacterium]|nr:TIM barrel protein [Saprospiraceae bacterium]